MLTKEQATKIIVDKVFLSTNKDLFDFVKSKITNEKGIPLKEFIKYQVYPKELELLPKQEIAWFIEAIEEYDPKICKLSDFMTVYETKELQYYSRKLSSVSDLLTFENAYPIGDNQWSCVVSVKQLAELKTNNLIRIDPSFQRQSKMAISQTDEILRQIYINWRRVGEIEKAIADDEYHYNMIRLNLINDGINMPTYNERSKKLTLPLSGDIIIPDGNHRIWGATRAYNNNQNLVSLFEQRFFTLTITHYDAIKVKEMISQEWNTERVTEKQKKAMKVNMANYIVDFIKNRTNGSEPLYANAISVSGIDIRRGKAFISYSDLSEAIDICYNANEFKLYSQANKVGEWLIQFYNYLTYLFLDDFEEKHSSVWNISNAAWCGFVYISSIIRDKENWKEILKSFIDGDVIDWGELPFGASKIRPTPNNFINYFKEKAMIGGIQ